MKLSPDQQRGVDAGKAGLNVGFFGPGECAPGGLRRAGSYAPPGGVGKTAAVESLLSSLRGTLILALSGLLALNEGGRTLHSFLLLSPETEINDHTYPKLVLKGIKALKSPRHSYHSMITGPDRCTIVLAEISQWSRWQFELLETVIRSVSANTRKRWGGHQLIVSGDFCQHPPVMPGYKDPYATSCIFSSVFKESLDKIVELTTQHRQRSGDADVADITIGVNHEVRKGMLSKRYGSDTMAHVVYRRGRDPMKQVLRKGAVYLARTRKEVARFNSAMLKHFPTQFKVKPFRKKGQAEDQQLAIGSTVMFHTRSTGKNADHPPYKAVNGTRGTLMNWTGPRIICKETASFAHVQIDGVVYAFPMHLQFGNVDTPLSRQTVDRAIGIEPPFRTAFALTIAKCQGLTLDRVVYNAAGINASDLYIIVSRVRNIRHLFPDHSTGPAFPDILQPVEGLQAVHTQFESLKGEV